MRAINASVLAILLLGCPGLLHAHAGLCRVTLLESPTMFVDPTCNNCTGEVILQLRNDGSKPVKLELTFGDIIDKNTHRPLNAKFEPPEILKGPYGDVIRDKDTLETGENIFVRVRLVNLIEEGESQAEIHNRGAKIGTLKVVKYPLPLGVKLDVSNPDDPELFVRKGKLAMFALKNDDAIAYPLLWELVIKGVSHSIQGIAATTPQLQGASLPSRTTSSHRNSCESDRPPIGAFTISAKSGVQEVFCPPGDWFDNKLEGFFKDEIAEGRLILRFRPFGTAIGAAGLTADTPAKIIKVKTHLTYVRPQQQFTAILLVLLLGAVTSLFLNGYVPNQIRRIRVTRDLNSLAQRIRELPMTLASRLRVLIGVERARLHTQLREIWGGAPGFSAVVNDVKQGSDRLKKRLDLVEGVGDARVRFERQRSDLLFPLMFTRIEAKFDDVIEILRKSQFAEDDEQAAKLVLGDIDSLLGNLENTDKLVLADPGLPKQLKERAKRLHQQAEPMRAQPPERTDYGPVDESASIQRRARQVICNLDAQVRDIEHTHENGSDLFSPQEIPIVDLAITKADLIREALGRADTENMAKLLQLVTSRNYEDLDAAMRLVREIGEGIFPQNLGEELTVDSIPILMRIPRQWTGGALLQARQILQSISVFFLIVTLVSAVAALGVWVGGYDWWTEALSAALMSLVLSLSFAGFGVLTRLFGSIAWLWDRIRPTTEQVRVANEQKVHIQQTSSEVRVYQATPLKIKFEKERFNGSPALGDIVPMWNFYHDKLTGEEGWQVEHYFPRPGAYLVTVTFKYKDGRPIVGRDSDPIHVVKTIAARPREMGAEKWAFWLGLTKLLIALVPAVLVLYSGAAEKLQKLDLFTALIAIFLLGFTSDQMKNLLADQPE